MAIQKTSAFLNLLTAKEKSKYVDVCWDILQKAYASIGGFKSSDSKEDLIKDHFLWKLGRKGDKIVAVAIYKKQFGRKRVASATDGTPVGKKVLEEIYREDFTRAWTECSGAVEKMLMRLGGEKYRIPAEYAQTLTNKPVVPAEDGFHYTRQIGDHKHEKVIIGSPEGLRIKHVARMLRLASDPLHDIVIRPEGWGTTSDEAAEVLDQMGRKGLAWRGMTSAEYQNTVGKGLGVQSRGDFSFAVEGTQFASHPADAESYVNFGRDDPRKSGKHTYLVGVRRTGMRKKPDGYLETEPGVGVPDSDVVAVYEFYPQDGAVLARKLR